MTARRRRSFCAFFVQVHLWLGLTLGVIGALLGISGCILVYDHEVDAWLNPQRYAVTATGTARPIADYTKRAEAALGNGARTTALRFPDRESGPVIAFVRARGEGGAFQRVYLDPATGDVLDQGSGRDLVAWLHGFHESLMLRELKGREIVGAVGIAMLVSSLSGLYLWWPAGGLRRDAPGFRHGFALHRNLHYTVGFYGALVLAILSFTGIFLGYPDAGRAVVGALATVSPSPRGIQGAAVEGRPIDPDEAVAIARERYGNAAVTGIGFPAGGRGAYRVSLREAGDAHSRSATVVFVDPRTRAVLLRVDRATRGGGDTFLLWNRILHEGGVFGAGGRFATFLGGLMPPVLLVTGLLMWLRQRQRKRVPRAAARAAAD